MAIRILVVGAGAVGGYFGARLAEAGRDVTFLVRPSRAAQLRQRGLRIISPHGNATLQPTLISTDAIETSYDLVLLSVKGYALEAAMSDFAPGVGSETMILPVLNGMRHIDLLVRRFGEAVVIGGVCRVATELDDTGRIVQIADIQQLIYGERNGETTARVKALDATLRGAGFDARLSSDVMQAMWEKWVQLASLGAVNCLLRGAIGEIVATQGGTEVSLALVNECAAIATACGHKPSDSFMKQHISAMTAAGSPLTSSMYRDLRKGAPVEAEQILGDLLERGRIHQVNAPLLNAAAVNLGVYQNQLVKQAGSDSARAPSSSRLI